MSDLPTSITEKVDSEFHRTVSNLISNAVNSLCQQFIQYECSVEVFGLLSVNVDDNLVVDVKLNEKFIKRDENNILSNSCPVTTEDKEKHTESINDNHLSVKVSGLIDDCSMNSGNNEKKSLEMSMQSQTQLLDSNIVKDNSNKENENATYFSETEIDNKNNDIEPKIEDKVDEGKSQLVFVRNLLVENRPQIEPVALKLSKANMLFKCSVCNREFNRKFSLTRHERIHRNLKPYNCTICSLGFDSNNQLQGHVENTHFFSRDVIQRASKILSDQVESNGAKEINNSSGLLCSTRNSLAKFSNYRPPIASLKSLPVEQHSSGNPKNRHKYPTVDNPLFYPLFPDTGPSFPYNNLTYGLPNYPYILPATQKGLYTPPIPRMSSNTEIQNVSSSNNQPSGSNDNAINLMQSTLPNKEQNKDNTKEN